MAVSDWISRLFSSGNAKGLSGEESALEPDAPWFDGRLRRHQAGGDLISDPTLIWSTANGTGLMQHLRARTADQAADFSDILVVVNAADWARGMEQLQEPWSDRAARSLETAFDTMSHDGTITLAFAARGLSFRLIADGGPEMVGEDYGLEPGEFVTGLVPNLYTAPKVSSRPVVAIHLNLPDVWDGYREVGRLYSDQVSFTLGNHWLDSFSHFALQEPALYRLQQYLDGNLVHIIDPDLQSKYQVVNNQDAGANVLTIMDSDGEVVAHLVLALMDSIVPDDREPEPAPAPAAAQPPGIEMPTPVVPEPTPSFIGGNLDTLGHKTIVPESVQERILALKERGALLQKVHFHKFMKGYDVYVSGNGNLTTRTQDRAATFQVRQNQVSLVVHRPEVLVDGRPAPLETPRRLEDSVTLKVGPHELRYNDLTRFSATQGWPYLGEILRPSSSNHLVFGGTYGIGRDRRNKVQLPDEPHNDNIAWLDNSDSGVIRARSGEIRKSQFYTDSIMVASRHAEIDLAGDPALTNIAKHCYTYVRRGDRLFPLVPTKQQGERSLALEVGDEILVGNCLFVANYGPDAAAAPPPPPPPPKLTAESLARAADGDTWADSVEPSQERDTRRQARSGKAPASLIDEILNARPKRDTRSPDLPKGDGDQTPSLDALLNERRTPKPDDIPAAAGLGEQGLPPALPEITRHGYDSLMGLDPSEPDVLEVESELDDELDGGPEVEIEGDLEDQLSVPPPPRVHTLDQEDFTDEAGALFGLPAPDSPRQDFDVVGDSPQTPERMVEIEDSERDGPVYDGALSEAPAHPSAPELAEDLSDPETELPGPSVLEPPKLAALPEFAAPQAPVDAPAVEPPAVVPPAPKPPAPKPRGEDLTVIPDPEGVAVVDEEGVQVQLARPGRLVHIGWALSGEVLVGNHYGADVVVPENRLDPDQRFEACDYLSMRVRGDRGKATLLTPSEARLEKDGDSVETAKGLSDIGVEIVRRDEDGDEDFVIELAFNAQVELPDPRARLLAIDLSDRIVASLFIRGLPLGTDTRLRMGPIRATLRFDGESATLAQYLDSYRRTDGYQPFFHRPALASAFSTVPEDGRSLTLQPGDLLIAGVEVYRFEKR